MSLCGDVDAADIRMPLHRFAGTIRQNKHREDRAHGRLQNPLAQMMSVPESRAVVGRHDGIYGRDSLFRQSVFGRLGGYEDVNGRRPPGS